MQPSANEIIRFEHVSKQYPGTLANDDVTLSIEKGEVFALVGENGAGKSTLMKMIAGIERPSAGKMYMGGEEVSFRDTNDARARGIDYQTGFLPFRLLEHPFYLFFNVAAKVVHIGQSVLFFERIGASHRFGNQFYPVDRFCFFCEHRRHQPTARVSIDNHFVAVTRHRVNRHRIQLLTHRFVDL